MKQKNTPSIPETIASLRAELAVDAHANENDGVELERLTAELNERVSKLQPGARWPADLISLSAQRDALERGNDRESAARRMLPHAQRLQDDISQRVSNAIGQKKKLTMDLVTQWQAEKLQGLILAEYVSFCAAYGERVQVERAWQHKRSEFFMPQVALNPVFPPAQQIKACVEVLAQHEKLSAVLTECEERFEQVRKELR